MPCSDDCAMTSSGCWCTNILSIPFNQTVQLVITNMGQLAFAMHPVHLHGHSFFVMKVSPAACERVHSSMCSFTFGR